MDRGVGNKKEQETKEHIFSLHDHEAVSIYIVMLHSLSCIIHWEKVDGQNE